MLSDADVAVTSQAGVLDLPFVKKAGACRQVARFSRPQWKPATGRGEFAGADDRGFHRFRATMPAFAAWYEPIRPTSHLAAGRFHGYSLCRTLPSSSG